jgi:phosphoglycerate dehydrogenase-like enzyme
MKPGSSRSVYGHETGITEYAIGAILALTREFSRLDSALRHGDGQSQWAVGAPIPPAWPELAGKTIGFLAMGGSAKRSRGVPAPSI